MPVLSAREIRAYAETAGFNNEGSPDLDIAVAVALAESGGNTSATHQNTDAHHSIDYGVWQINSYWHADLLHTHRWDDPAQNAVMAFAVFKDAGYQWTPWSTFTSGAYRKYLVTATMSGSAGSWHTVVPGDTVSEVAQHAGITPWTRVWQDPHNAALVALRKRPESIRPGDRLYLPV